MLALGVGVVLSLRVVAWKLRDGLGWQRQLTDRQKDDQAIGANPIRRPGGRKSSQTAEGN